VATGAGLHSALAGRGSLPGVPASDAVMESELRYYAAFYAWFGLQVLRLAPRADTDARALRGLAGVVFTGGVARAGAWRAAGRPHGLQRGLLAIELAAPPLVIAWQARLAGRGRT